MSEEFYISLFSDDPETPKANEEFKQFIDKFAKELKALRKKWEHLGANDTAVSECLVNKISELVE